MLRLISSLALLLISANLAANTNNQNIFTAPGRIQISGAGASYNLGILGGDALIPLNKPKEGLLFMDLMGDYASNATYLVSPGIGLRLVHQNQIFGASFFGDYEKTSLGGIFWNLSPGIEWITPRWDTHINAYFPTQTTDAVGATDYANTFGNDSYVTFETGTHNQYDELLTPYAVIGNGIDTSIGYSFDDNFKNSGQQLRSRVYVGAYYYQTPNNFEAENITGVTGGLSQALSKNLTISVLNSYDQLNQYTVGLSLTLTFGGNSNLFSQDVHDRLFDAVQRHIGIIDTGAANYDQQSYQEAGIGLEYDNIYFVSPDGTGNGTYGNPMPLTQTSLDDAYTNNPNGSLIYIQGGEDSVYEVNSSTATESELNTAGNLGLYVYNGQDFYGRNADYTTSAANNEQPQIAVDGFNNYSAFITQGGENTFSDLNIFSSTPGYGAGIFAYNNGTEDSIVTVNHTSISAFTKGLSAINNSSGTLTINAYQSYFNDNTASGNGVTAYGMIIANTGSGTLILNADTSYFNDNSSIGDGAQVVGLGIFNQSSGNIIVNATRSEFNNNETTGNNQPIAAGLYVFNASTGQVTINTSYSTFNDNTSNSFEAFGMEIINTSTGTLNINISNSQFDNNTAGLLSAGLYAGNLAAGTLTIDANNSNFQNNTGAYGYGFYAQNFSTGDLSVNENNSLLSGNTTDNSVVS